jgi:uncharacterized protein YbjT (DUF2867 family)
VVRIAVTTPTGHVGSRVVQLLIQAGVRPVLLLRDPSKLDADTLHRVDVWKGDQADAEFVREATAGVDALFWVDPTDTDIETSTAMGANAAKAIRANGIPRVVFQSSVGAEKRTGVGLIDGLARVEEQLDDTGADVTHLRCGYFFTNLLLDIDSLRAGHLVTAMPADVPHPWVDPRDIGDIAAARLLSAHWTGRHAQAVHGPRDLTFTEVAATITRVTGHHVAVRVVTDDEVRAGLLTAGLPQATVDGIVGMTAGLREDFEPEQRRDVVTTTPTTLEAWSYVHLAPLLR